VGAPGSPPTRLFGLDDLALLGPHNLRNALVAAAVARLLGAGPEAITAGARAFRPLAHRLEPVGRSAEGVRFVNDSAATTPEAAIAALAAVDPPVVLLAGGADKQADYAELGRAAVAAGATVVCLGATGERIAAAVAAAGGDPVRVAGDFEAAFAEAARRSRPGGTVLLAPAAASYDMFTNFKQRGERFQELAGALIQGEDPRGP